MLKWPKTLKDMLFKVTKSNLKYVNELLTVGFITTGLEGYGVNDNAFKN